MSLVNSIRYQYRTFESTYLFKVKNEGEVSLKILDLFQKCFFKKTFSSKEISFLNIEYFLAKGNFTPVLERLVEKSLLPKKHLLPRSIKITQKTCEQVFDQVIDQFKPKVFVERKEIEGFTCPLTLEIFQEPVMDEYGHTYEKSAIEAYLKIKNESPINRWPIHSLVPNRLVKQTIEEWKNQDPIPNFSLFKKENPKLAKTNLQMAQTYIEEKEYQEALECYTKAFQYTRNDDDYASIPHLFESIGEYEKVTLAYLYLAKYQFLAGKTSEAIKTLESCQRGKSFSLQNNLVLIELYYRSDQPKKALALSIQTAETFSKQNPKQATTLYKHILRDHPVEFPFYFSLAALSESPQEKSQILLKGAIEALRQEDYKAAEKLIQEAGIHSGDSFIDGLVSLDLLKKQGQIPGIKQKLLYLAKTFEKKQLPKQLLRVYKMLFQIEKNPEYCQKILSAYQTLKKPQKEFEWALISIALLIEQKKWGQAENLAKQSLKKSPEALKRVALYEKLEEVYTNWNGHKLQDLWPKLGKAYQQSKQLALAEKTYRKAFERFHGFKEALALAEALKGSGKMQESVQTYYEAAVEALLEQKTERLSLCTRGIKQIDPHLQHLNLNQRMHLLTQEHILKLSKELYKSQQKIASLEQVVQPLKEKAIREKKQIEIQTKLRKEFSQVFFGKAEWEIYFGSIGIEPPLPEDILEILKSPCPYWKEKKVEETHILVLIPQTINGKSLTLNTIKKITKSPQGGGHRPRYCNSYDRFVESEFGDEPISSSYWILMTKKLLPNSRIMIKHRENRSFFYESSDIHEKKYSERQAFLKKPYVAPHALEVVTAILMHYTKNGEELYNADTRLERLPSYESKSILISCQEKDSTGRHLMVGWSDGYQVMRCFHGLSVLIDEGPNDGYNPVPGVCGIRRLGDNNQ